MRIYEVSNHENIRKIRVSNNTYVVFDSFMYDQKIQKKVSQVQATSI